jgi:uncharacterized glyoxalase superfamily protein PhnB
MAMRVPEHHQRLIPYLYYRDPAAAIDFLAKAFGFTVRMVHKDDSGKVMHAQVGIGDATVMLGPAQAEFSFASPAELPARHAGVWCYVEDVDAHCARARAAGAKILRGPQDMFYGMREYDARDAEGQEWFFATPLGAGRPERKPEARAKKKPPVRKAKAQAKARGGAGRPARPSGR